LYEDLKGGKCWNRTPHWHANDGACKKKRHKNRWGKKKGMELEGYKGKRGVGPGSCHATGGGGGGGGEQGKTPSRKVLVGEGGGPKRFQTKKKEAQKRSEKRKKKEFGKQKKKN